MRSPWWVIVPPSTTKSVKSKRQILNNPSADSGPGSKGRTTFQFPARSIPERSSTSSSLSTDRYGGQLSTNQKRGEQAPNAGLKMSPFVRGHRPSIPERSSTHNVGFNTHGLSPARTRCPTPPLLFGRNAIGSPGSTDRNSHPTLGNGSSRFELNSKAIRPQNSARLPTALSGLGEEDWETVSARTEAAYPSFDRIALEAKTGSSLADTSDSGSLSLSKETIHPSRGMKLHPVTQHAVLPRQNHSFMLLKNSQTGDTKPRPVVVRDQEDGHREQIEKKAKVFLPICEFAGLESTTTF
ncbi:hypothetical protein BDR22DRAFT_823656 [Usnea florida]